MSTRPHMKHAKNTCFHKHLRLQRSQPGKPAAPARAPTWLSPAFCSCLEGLGLCLTKTTSCCFRRKVLPLFPRRWRSHIRTPGSEAWGQVRSDTGSLPLEEKLQVCVWASLLWQSVRVPYPLCSALTADGCRPDRRLPLLRRLSHARWHPNHQEGFLGQMGGP